MAAMCWMIYTFANYLDEQQGMGVTQKFEFKSAKDVTQRLEDVKGMDEIK